MAGTSNGPAAGPVRRRGFTLLEVMVAVVIVGIGVAGMMAATQSNTRVNASGCDLTQATYLLEEIREWSMKLPYADPNGHAPGTDNPPNDVSDFLHVTFSPPRDACGGQIAGLPGWSQVVTAQWKNPASLQNNVAAGSSDVVRITVTITHNSVTVLASSWNVVRRPGT
jgi:MSHA pilin protein MshD